MKTLQEYLGESKDMLLKHSYYFGISAFLDLLFLFIFGFVYLVFMTKIMEYAYALGLSIDPGALSAFSAINLSYLLLILLLLSLLLFFLFIIWNVIQSSNFRHAKMIVDNKKLDRKDYLMKFSKVNIINFLLFGGWWVISYFQTFVQTTDPGSGTNLVLFFLSVILLLLLIYFTVISYYLAFEKNAIKKSFNFAKEHANPLLFFFLILVAMFFAIDYLTTLIGVGLSYLIQSEQILYLVALIINAIILLPLLAYVRIAMFNFIKQIGANKK